MTERKCGNCLLCETEDGKEKVKEMNICKKLYKSKERG